LIDKETSVRYFGAMGRIAGLRGAQQASDVEGNVAAESVSRSTLMLALGSLVVAAIELPAIDNEDWSALITALVDRFRTGGAA
jgi:hypothetical protein